MSTSIDLLDLLPEYRAFLAAAGQAAVLAGRGGADPDGHAARPGPGGMRTGTAIRNRWGRLRGSKAVKSVARAVPG